MNIICYRREEAAFNVLADTIEDEIDAGIIPDSPIKKRKRTRGADRVKVKEELKCDNELCKDFGKVFKFVSKKQEHDRYVFHYKYL